VVIERLLSGRKPVLQKVCNRPEAVIHIVESTVVNINILGLSLLLALPMSSALASTSKESQKMPIESHETKAKFMHFVVIADGVAGPATDEYGVRQGPAVFSIKVWTTSSEDAVHMAKVFAKHSGFEMFGRLEIYTGGEITSPARSEPYGYAVKFYPYDPSKKD